MSLPSVNYVSKKLGQVFGVSGRVSISCVPAGRVDPGCWAECWFRNNKCKILIPKVNAVHNDLLTEIIAHEYAHALTYLSSPDHRLEHGQLWGQWYSKVYRVLWGEPVRGLEVPRGGIVANGQAGEWVEIS